MNENQENLSILQYFKKKYNIKYLEDIVGLFYLSLLCSIIIYLSISIFGILF